MVAVKPQSFREAGAALKAFTGSSTLVVSIMAGTPIAALEAVVGGSVVRAMPNTPAAIGRGITVAVAAKKVSAAQRAIADALLRATGLGRMGRQGKPDGRGDGGVRLRARPTCSCSPKNSRAPASRPACRRSLRPNWRAKPSPAPANCCTARTSRRRPCARTSPLPGGTTAAALEVLMGSDGMEKLMTRAVAAATQRSKDLAK